MEYKPWNDPAGFLEYTLYVMHAVYMNQLGLVSPLRLHYNSPSSLVSADTSRL